MRTSMLEPMTSDLDRCYLGYDPGGNGSHGVAAIRVRGGAVVDRQLATPRVVTDVLDWFLDPDLAQRFGPAVGIGIDTLTYWHSGESGLRRADSCLRDCFDRALNEAFGRKRHTTSVTALNGLRSSMTINGMFVLRRLRDRNHGLYVTETHPKILHWALFGKPYAAYPGNRPSDPPENAMGARRKEILSKIEKWESAHDDWEEMNPRLATVLCLDSKSRADFSPNSESGALDDARTPASCGVPGNDHEWDALISAWAAYRGHEYVQGGAGWEKNLVDGDLVDDEAKIHLDFPAGCVDYRWPGDEEIADVRERHRALIDK